MKTGYARNYLLPKGFAYSATEKNLKIYEQEKVRKEKDLEKLRFESKKLRTKLEKISLTAAVKVGDDGKLFGSVNSHTISDLLKEQGYDFNHRKIVIEDSIKELGVYEIEVHLYSGIEAKIKVWVVKE